jgi:replication factor C subunit 1
MNELCHHMNYKISAGTTEMRMSYLPLMKARFLSLLSSDGQDGIQEAIELMDDYGLDRDDIFEKLDEFNIEASGKEAKGSFQKIDSKKKATFTRLYNQGSHRSQALVAAQGATKKSKRASSSSGMTELDDPDAIDDDMVEAEDEGNDEDEDGQDLEKIRAAFQKKGSRAAAKKTTAAKKPAARGKKK